MLVPALRRLGRRTELDIILSFTYGETLLQEKKKKRRLFQLNPEVYLHFTYW